MPSKLEITITSLDLLVPVAEVVPILGAPIKGSLEAAKRILEYAKSVRNNKQATNDLAEQAALWARDIVNAVQEAQSDGHELRSLEPSVLYVLRVLEEIAAFQKERANQSVLKASFRKQDDAEKITKLRDELRAAYERFTTMALMRTEAAVARTEIAVQNMTSKVDIDFMRKTLSPVFSASFDARDSPPGCMEATRTDVLRAIYEWIHHPQKHLSVYWLSGMAGTGKTTIAKTLCEALSNDRVLASSFFVSRQSAIRRDPFNIIRTMAYDLTRLDDTILGTICRLVQKRPDISDRPMEEQIQMLLVDPLTEFFASRSRLAAVVIVVDALDECNSNADCRQLLSLLGSKLAKCPIKLLVTSRNEKHIRLAFESIPHDSLKLHDLEQSIISSDIRRFFEISLNEVARNRNMAPEWPSTEDIERLTELTGYLLSTPQRLSNTFSIAAFCPTDS